MAADVGHLSRDEPCGSFPWQYCAIKYVFSCSICNSLTGTASGFACFEPCGIVFLRTYNQFCYTYFRGNWALLHFCSALRYLTAHFSCKTEYDTMIVLVKCVLAFYASVTFVGSVVNNYCSLFVVSCK